MCYAQAEVCVMVFASVHSLRAWWYLEMLVNVIISGVLEIQTEGSVLVWTPCHYGGYHYIIRFLQIVVCVVKVDAYAQILQLAIRIVEGITQKIPANVNQLKKSAWILLWVPSHLGPSCINVCKLTDPALLFRRTLSVTTEVAVAVIAVIVIVWIMMELSVKIR